MTEELKLKPAGPKGDWLLGNAESFKNDPLNFMVESHRRYGDCVQMRIGTFPMLLICDPELIHEVLVTKAASFTKDAAIKNNPEFFGNGLLRSEGEYWKRQRKLASPAFNPKRLEAYGAQMIELCQSKLASWRDGETRDMQKEMMQLTLSIAAKTLFDVGLEHNEEFELALENAQKYLGERMDDFILLLLPEWVPFPSNIHLLDAVHKIDKFVYALIKERRNEAEGRNDLLSCLISVRDDDGTALSDQEIRDEVFTLFFAGHETTALTLSWTLYLLSQNKDAEEKLLQEIRETLKGKTPEAHDAHRLDFARRVVMESMRLIPPVWAIGREASEDCRIGEYEVKKGTSILISQWVNNRDERWFKNPELFDPERWTPEFCAELPKYAYFPFGGGPRTCIGNNFALMEAVLLLAMIARDYHLELAAGEKVELKPAVTLRPKNGLKMNLHKRL